MLSVRTIIVLTCFIATTLQTLALSSSLPISQTPGTPSNSNTCKTMSKSLRSVLKIIPQQPQHWVGDGFHVYPVLGQYAFTETISPWLMFDYAAPKTFTSTSSRRGVGQHPHRGFETITIAFEGEVEHADSTGNTGVIGPGDVQWMTAARGIIHEEFHSTEFAKKGGAFEMCQLWLNLPSKDKMTPPKYQPILNKDIPSVDIKKDNGEEVIGSIRVIAGEYNGTVGPANTFTPVELWDISIEKKNAPFTLNIPPGHNLIVFTRKGSIVVTTAESEEKLLKPQSVALMSQEGDSVSLTALDNKSQILIMAGKPLNEPIAARGPFVMNTQKELKQAMHDYQSGVF